MGGRSRIDRKLAGSALYLVARDIATRAGIEQGLILAPEHREERAKALLIGRRALIALGLPVMTRDYDYWIPADDAHALNEALRPLEMFPTRSPEEARLNGRYVIEGDEHVDVLVARAVGTTDGTMVVFNEVWQRRVYLPIAEGVSIAIPSIDDLILTKKFAARPRDADDVRWLEQLKAAEP